MYVCQQVLLVVFGCIDVHAILIDWCISALTVCSWCAFPAQVHHPDLVPQAAGVLDRDNHVYEPGIDPDHNEKFRAMASRWNSYTRYTTCSHSPSVFNKNRQHVSSACVPNVPEPKLCICLEICMPLCIHK